MEFALTLGFLAVPLLSVADLGVYTYDKMQLENAGQMASQAAWAACSTYATRPVTDYCNFDQTKYPGAQNAYNAISRAIQQTTLGAGITTSATAVTENYVCISSTGVISTVGNPGYFSGGSALSTTAPACADKSTPLDYLQVTVSYTYKPLFPGITVASLLPATMTKTTWIPMN